MTEEEHTEAPQEAVEAVEERVDAPEVDEAPQEVEQAPAWSDEDAQEAKLFGWKAPEEWQGEKPEGYIDNPQEYLGRVQRSRIFKTMQEKLEATEKANQEHARKLAAMNQRALERQRENYEAEMARITAAQRRAVEEADTDAYDALEKQRESLKPVEAPDAPQPQNEPHPEIAKYMQSDDGKWLDDPVLRAAGIELIDKTPGAKHMTAVEQAEFARQHLETIYPMRFPKKQAAPAQVRATVDPGGMAPGVTGKRSAFDKLPAEAKAEFKRFMKEGLYDDTKESREEYANDFNAA